MTQQLNLFNRAIAVLAFFVASVTSIAAGAGTVLYVVDVEQLYAAVNDPANAGARIVLASGTYVLTVTDAAGVARPNGGRLELQEDMSLYGVAGDGGAVVIDARSAGLLSPSFAFGLPAGQRTGVIRAGRGSNAIEWLTVLGKPDAAAAIETDLPGTSSTWIRVAHVVGDGSSRGVDVRNAGFANNAGRRIDAEIVDNEFIGPTVVQGMSEGIRLANFVGADGGRIVATLRRNRAHGFQLGCIVANNRSSHAAIYVRSSRDRFFANGRACLIAGGLNQQATGAANQNSTVFEAFGSEFVDNTPDGAIRVAGGYSSALTYVTTVTSDNTVSVSLSGSKVSGNLGVDFEAFGAIQTNQLGPAGTTNHVTITLRGVSALTLCGEIVAKDSVPEDPSTGNTVTVRCSPAAR